MALLPSASQGGARQRFFLFFFFEKFFAECHLGWLSAKIIYFFKKILFRVPRGWHSTKLGTTAAQCPALPSASTQQS